MSDSKVAMPVGAKPRRDRRLRLLLLTSVAILTLGAVIAWFPQHWMLLGGSPYRPSAPVESARVEPVAAATEGGARDWALPASGAADAQQNPAGHAQQQLDAQLKILFEHGITLMAQGNYEQALRAMAMVLEVSPDMPEAHANMGFALYELRDYVRAKVHFRTAIEVNPLQANAYYGLAMVHEAEADLESALGAMRSFIHLTRGHEDYVAKARAAIWEWEEQLAKIRAQAEGEEPGVAQKGVQVLGEPAVSRLLNVVQGDEGDLTAAKTKDGE